jgi:hypothetical protein
VAYLERDNLGGLIRGVAYLEGDNLEVFYYLSALVESNLI